jgi:hypothetical protein
MRPFNFDLVGYWIFYIYMAYGKEATEYKVEKKYKWALTLLLTVLDRSNIGVSSFNPARKMYACTFLQCPM